MIHKYRIGDFNIRDAFEIVDMLFEKNCFMSVSCDEKNNQWMVEILNNRELFEYEIQDFLKGYEYSKIKVSALENIDWLRKCFENFKPISVGDFYVYGKHLRGTVLPPDKICIEISASTAFGTGEHSSTSRCLMAIQSFFDYEKHTNALDLGCGSGILSIALAKIGARNVIAYDSDAEAVKVSGENIIINKVEHRISIFQNRDAEFSRRQYDFIVANILSAPLISMSGSIVNSLSDDGVLVLSGFTTTDNSVSSRYLSLGLRMLYRYDHEDWTTIVLTREKNRQQNSI
jgi:ribosomal protein L11 methyltransferase